MLEQLLTDLYVSFCGSNDFKLEIILLGDSMGSTDGKVLGSDEASN